MFIYVVPRVKRFSVKNNWEHVGPQELDLWLGFRFIRWSQVGQRAPEISHEKALSTIPRAELENMSRFDAKSKSRVGTK